MARLIDAYALERSFRDVMEPDVPLYLNIITGMINAAPTVDAESVRHGRWEELKDGMLECSECHSIAPYEENRWGDVVNVTSYDYCPWCGAKMDGGENDGEAGH